jgi:hypothetical protein
MEIYVFKTNVRYKKNIHEIAPHLDMIAEIKRWNIDLHDKDKILRIEAFYLSPRAVEKTLQHAGYSCKELVD